VDFGVDIYSRGVHIVNHPCTCMIRASTINNVRLQKPNKMHPEQRLYGGGQEVPVFAVLQVYMGVL
jgi:hypothetical protein